MSRNDGEDSSLEVNDSTLISNDEQDSHDVHPTRGVHSNLNTTTAMNTNPPVNNNQTNRDINNSVAVSRRTNRAPPIMAFFRHRNFYSPNDKRAIDESGYHPHPPIQPSQSYESQNHELEMEHSSLLENNDLTSSLIIPSSSSSSENRYTLSNFFRVVLDRELHDRIKRTIRRSGHYIAYCTLLAMLIIVPTVLYRSLIDRKLDTAAINSARVMVIGTFIMSLRLVYLHLTHWFMPDVQKYVVRILWMVPIYAMQSYLSLRYHHARVYMSTIRDFYEAFVITSFVYYLVELLGGQESLVHILQQKDPLYGHHKFPISLVLEPWVVGEEFLLQCKHGVLQYVVFKTTATILIFLCEYFGVYGEGHFEWFVAYPYLCFFQNISVMYALYCLVIFFHACNEELRHPVNWNPLGKFLCIKGVVFFTWWQGVIIFYLRDHGIIGPMGPWSSIDVANGFIDYCIVVEMVGFAIAHSYTFTYIEYLPGRFPHLDQSNSNDRNPENDISTNLLSNDDVCTSSQRRVQHYRAPATLPEPMRFRDALWSSTVPHETIQDIQRLRAGVDSAMNHTQPTSALSRGISLSSMINGELLNLRRRIGSDNGNEVVGGGDPELEHPLPEPEAEVSLV